MIPGSERSIRTVTLRFLSPTSKQFDAYARRKGFIPSWSMDGRWQKACVVFGSATDKRRFMAGWGNESCQGYEPELRLSDRSKLESRLRREMDWEAKHTRSWLPGGQ